MGRCNADPFIRCERRHNGQDQQYGAQNLQTTIIL
jgi:hypothetical protein